MKKLHQENKTDFDDLSNQIKEKKIAYLKNMEQMKSKMRGHSQVFDSIKNISDKLPELFDHFKNLINKLSQNKNLPEINEKDSESSLSNSEKIIQHDQTIEEDILNEEFDEDEDVDEESSEETSSESSNDEPVGEPIADEGKSMRNDQPEEANASEIANTLDHNLEEINQHPNFTMLDDGIVDKLENEQKEFEIKQKNQNDEINGLKFIDNGIIDNGKIRKEYGDKFVKYLDSQVMKDAPKDVKDHLKYLNDLFLSLIHI